MARSGIGARIRAANGNFLGAVRGDTALTWLGPGAKKHEHGSVWFWEEDFLDFIEEQDREAEEHETKEVDQASTEKAMMKLKKKLREVEALERRRDAGEILAPNQLEKMGTKSALEEELQGLRVVSAAIVCISVSISRPGGQQVLAATALAVGTRIDTLAKQAASAMGHSGDCLLLSEMGILPAHATLAECHLSDGVNLVAVTTHGSHGAPHDDVAIVRKHFGRMLMRLMPKLPKQFSVHTLLREGVLYQDNGRITGLALQQMLAMSYMGQELPKEIGLLTDLRYLGLCDVPSLPKEVGNLASLKELVLIQGDIDKLPQEIGQLVSLERISLVQLNCLTELPDEIDGLANLRVLEIVDCNRLATLPPGVSRIAQRSSDAYYQMHAGYR